MVGGGGGGCGGGGGGGGGGVVSYIIDQGVLSNHDTQV